ncbi:MAG: two-component system sensor histidine kinase NtrB [Planctomycetota bacterium]|jgi:signal transduction histidine kinase
MKAFQWLTWARWVATGCLMLSALVGAWRGIVESVWPLLAVSAFVGLYNLGFFFTVRGSESRATFFTRTALFLDILALTAYLHFSGDIENPMGSAYALPVIAGAVIVSRRLAFALAGTVLLLFGCLMFATLVDASPVPLKHHHLALLEDFCFYGHIDPDVNPQGPDYVVLYCFVLAALLAGASYGFGTLAMRIRQRDVEILREHDRMALLLNTLPEGVSLLQEDGIILLANPAARKLVGGTSVAGLEAELGLMARLATSGVTHEEFETQFRDRILNCALARSSPDGPIVWAFRDVTESRRLIAQLAHKSKMADIGLLAAGIAHEIGNPLSSMSAIVQILQMKSTSSDISERLHALGAHIDRINRIVRDVTDFARPSGGKRKRVLLEGVVKRALEIFLLHKKSQGIHVRFDAPEKPVHREVEEDQVLQVILNLLINAADASSEGASIEVAVRQQEGDALICVIDHGEGITEEVRRHLFAPFFTTKDPGKGVGLGLFTSDAIMRLQGGRIEVASTPGGGSTFTVHLPSASKE